MNGRRRKIVPISPLLLHDLFTTNDRAMTIRCAEGLPPDARFVGHDYDFQRDMHFLVFESDEWEEVPEFEMLPIFVPALVRYTVAPLLEQAAELLVNARTEEMGDRDYAAALTPWLQSYEQMRGVLE